MKSDIPNDEWLLRLCDRFESLAKEMSHAFGSGDKGRDLATYDDALRQLSQIYGKIFPGRSLFSSIVLPSDASPVGITVNDKADIAKLTAKALSPEFNDIKVHVTDETNRIVAAKKPKRENQKLGVEAIRFAATLWVNHRFDTEAISVAKGRRICKKDVFCHFQKQLMWRGITTAKDFARVINNAQKQEMFRDIFEQQPGKHLPLKK